MWPSFLDIRNKRTKEKNKEEKKIDIERKERKKERKLIDMKNYKMEVDKKRRKVKW